MNTCAGKKFPWLDRLLFALAAIAGCVFAVVCLLFKPVTIIANDSPAQTVRANEVCHTQGSRDRVKGASWGRKRAALLAAAPGTITLNEDELNTWFAASTHTRASRHGAVQLDFRIDSGLLQVAAPATMRTPFGERVLLVQARGVFERIAPNPAIGMPGVVMYAPREAYAGSLPLHRIPGATRRLIDTLLQSQTPPGEALAAWQRIERVTINGRELRVIISAAGE